MSAAERANPLTAAETKSLFRDLSHHRSLIVAVSGGPDSTALLVLAARWRATLKSGPKLVAVTVDHKLRRESADEARAVGRLARKLGIAHVIVPWRGAKPKTGLQQAARDMRYRLLAKEASKIGARHVLTAHTLDDQAETVLIRLARGSGVAGLAAMARENSLAGVTIVRPLLDVPKARLIATLRREKIAFADDPSNRNPKFTRVRMRGLMAALAQEGLTAARLALLARRIRRADAAIENAVSQAGRTLARGTASQGGVAFDAAGFARLPEEIGLRLLGRAVARCGDEGPVELAKLERLYDAVVASVAGGGAIRRTLAGALVSLDGKEVVVERAPPRRAGGGRRIQSVNKAGYSAGEPGFAG